MACKMGGVGGKESYRQISTSLSSGHPGGFSIETFTQWPDRCSKWTEENNETTMGKQLRPQLSPPIKGSFAFTAEPLGSPSPQSPCPELAGMLPQQRAAWRPWESRPFTFWKWELGFTAGGKQPLSLPAFPNMEKIPINFVRKHFVMRVSAKH